MLRVQLAMVAFSLVAPVVAALQRGHGMKNVSLVPWAESLMVPVQGSPGLLHPDEDWNGECVDSSITSEVYAVKGTVAWPVGDLERSEKMPSSSTWCVLDDVTGTVKMQDTIAFVEWWSALVRLQQRPMASHIIMRDWQEPPKQTPIGARLFACNWRFQSCLERDCPTNVPPAGAQRRLDDIITSPNLRPLISSCST